MKKLNLSLATLAVAMLAFFAAPASAQVILTNTTLSAAVADSNSTRVTVTSATGITAYSAQDPTKATYLYVGREAMEVIGVNGNIISVVRGTAMTASFPHLNGALVFVVPQYLSFFFQYLPQGACTRTNELALPRIQFPTGLISDCLGGVWVIGDAMVTQRVNPTSIRLPEPGGAALTSLETAGTAPVATTSMYCTEVDLNFSMLMTGIALLNGTVVGTDNHLVALYDSNGNRLATSATAGALSAGASLYQKYNFTTPFYAVGPARYFGCFQTNGVTATVRHPITSVNDNIVAGAITGQVFGTVPAAVTLPSTFTTATGAYLFVY